MVLMLPSSNAEEIHSYVMDPTLPLVWDIPYDQTVVSPNAECRSSDCTRQHIIQQQRENEVGVWMKENGEPFDYTKPECIDIESIIPSPQSSYPPANVFIDPYPVERMKSDKVLEEVQRSVNEIAKINLEIIKATISNPIFASMIRHVNMSAWIDELIRLNQTFP